MEEKRNGRKKTRERERKKRRKQKEGKEWARRKRADTQREERSNKCNPLVGSLELNNDHQHSNH